MNHSELLFQRGKATEQILSPRQASQAIATEAVPERPALAPNVQLLGEMQETGFKARQWLLRRDDQFVQLTELLYRIAEEANGAHTLEEIATKVTETTDWLVSADHVRQLLQVRLMPLGLIVPSDGTAGSGGGVAGKHQTPSPLRLNMRVKVISPRLIEPTAKVLQGLYAPPVLIPVLIAIAVAQGWLYFIHGVTGSIRNLLYEPGLLLVVLAMMIVAGIFHEFGHASALRYGGGKVRGMGVGFYLIYPAFYTDVTDSYRLGRWARVRTDLGGFYFYLIFALGLIALYLISGHEVLLLPVLLINLDILYQCLPFVRFDGYWALADLTGIPDFFSHTGPFLRSVLPLPGWKGQKLPELKPWVKMVFAAYIFLTVPVLALLFFLMVTRVPVLIALTGDAFFIQHGKFAYAQSHGNVLGMLAAIVQIVLLALPLLASGYLLYSMSRTSMQAVWNWSHPTALHRLTAVLPTFRSTQRRFE
jgi:putative peptide zinc metalloprotease protein